MTTTDETLPTDAQMDAELTEHAEFMVSVLQDEIDMLQELLSEHDTGCSSRYPLLVEINALEGARLYFAEKVTQFSPPTETTPN